MDEDARLHAQLTSLGKKLFQFRELVAKIDIPDKLPESPNDKVFWDTLVKKCSSALTVLRQVHATLTPDMYHLAVFPGEKIWRNPAAVPDLLGMPDRAVLESVSPIARTREEVLQWNAQLDTVLSMLDQVLEPQARSSAVTASHHPNWSKFPPASGNEELIRILLTSISRERVHR
jgi:hypothetical protein